MKNFLYVFIGVFMFVSCSSSDNQLEEKLKTNRIFQNPMETVGEDHNFILNDIMMKWKRSDSKEGNFRSN
ncbi:hypothetical protein [Flavobacterium sp. NKUCC04_CG]|uniref:hypothetical protein n=1 Tax=Flavobacterium sp. NKUCC04_CG TaxID=2842121 RepID=UPI001C5B42F6|nr:hypothetical protein [Flavobacterium sp. NKUCC04_CG]MBW3519559.1 hypothetical protein [Flavobacterium sp. NKUCC04_CG]